MKKIDWTRAEERNARILDRDGDGCTVLLEMCGGGITLPQLKGAGERYLFGDVEVLEEHSAAMMFRCFLPGMEKERIYMRFGLLPRFKTRICLDLELLDNRTIFTNRIPGTLKLVVHGQRTNREEVERFELGTDKTHHDIRLRFENFFRMPCRRNSLCRRRSLWMSSASGRAPNGREKSIHWKSSRRSTGHRRGKQSILSLSGTDGAGTKTGS